MPDLICRFESLRSDKTLLDAQRLQLERMTDYYGDEDARVLKLQGSIRELETKLSEALVFLDQMVEKAPSAKEACRLSDERLFLTYRYLHDMTMEQTAEAMHVSRDTVYRIRRRIIGRARAGDAHSAARA